MPRPKLLRHLSLTCLVLLLSVSSRADTTFEIARQPLVLQAKQIQAIDPRDWAEQAQILADSWVHDHGSRLPKILARTAPDAEVDVESSFSKEGAKAMGKLVVQVMNFARDVSSQSRSFANNFHIQFIHAISERAPGFAWVVVAERTGFDVGWMSGFRAGGGAGVQIPLLGSDDLWVKDGHGQVVLRVLPLSGNFESVEVGSDTLHPETSPDTGLVLRPSAELDASYQYGGIKPGIRFLVQPKLLDPRETRMIAEIYANIDIMTDRITNISIVPRCMIDFSTAGPAPTAGRNSGGFAEGYKLLANDKTCSISAQVALGM